MTHIYTVSREHEVEGFTDHWNSQDPHVKFTTEVEEEGKLAFLYICVHHKDNGVAYLEATHADHTST